MGTMESLCLSKEYLTTSLFMRKGCLFPNVNNLIFYIFSFSLFQFQFNYSIQDKGNTFAPVQLLQSLVDTVRISNLYIFEERWIGKYINDACVIHCFFPLSSPWLVPSQELVCLDFPGVHSFSFSSKYI